MFAKLKQKTIEEKAQKDGQATPKKAKVACLSARARLVYHVVLMTSRMDLMQVPSSFCSCDTAKHNTIRRECCPYHTIQTENSLIMCVALFYRAFVVWALIRKACKLVGDCYCTC